MQDPLSTTGSRPQPAAVQLTVRSALTGVILGSLLSLCNLYSGLKIGWGFNMSITAALLSFGFWHCWLRLRRARPWGILENNINQTAASSAASVPTAGLMGSIPALASLTGQSLSWGALTVWTASVCLVGIVVAIGLRRQMILVEKLSFPLGVATAETLRDMYARGREALQQVRALLAAGLVSGGVKLAVIFGWITRVGCPVSLQSLTGGLVSGGASSTTTLQNLTFALDPSPMMLGVGALIGLRACASILAGSVLAWGVLGPLALDQGWVALPTTGSLAAWFGPLLAWLVWPGVALMVSASLTSFVLSWRSIGAAFQRSLRGRMADDEGVVSRGTFCCLILSVLVISVMCQWVFFGILPWTATLAVLLTFALALVAARVAGETGLTPTGPLSKITQFVFGTISPTNMATNMMTASVTSGAASQCADLMHDLKTGLMLGASARAQSLAQALGALGGCAVASAAYLVLVRDATSNIFTEQWPAPAAATLRAVAEVFARGLETLPPATLVAIIVAAALGIGLTVLERRVSPLVRRFIPPAASLGLAFVVPVWIALLIFAGGLLAWLLARHQHGWAERFLAPIASGLIAGESLTGVGQALVQILGEAL
ncbi:MAG: OPT family oligopeptide transporter [Planctomycetota bacterium]